MASSTTTPQDSLEVLISNLISSLHILHNNSVLDAYGHVSIRHPHDASLFLMPRNLAPALISSPTEDIVCYHISTAEPVDPQTAPRGYIERNIHAGIYRQYAHVQSVVHAHADSVVQFSILPPKTFRPVHHMSGFLGPVPPPTFEIHPSYAKGEQQDLLIRTLAQGDLLASYFSEPTSREIKDKVDHRVVLMRGHGYTVAAESLETAVYMAHYTVVNAKILSGALAASGGLGVGGGGDGGGSANSEGIVHCLSDQEAVDTWRGNEPTVARPMGLWKKEIEAKGGEGGLYHVNKSL